MKHIEENIVNSFRLAKNDIIQLQNAVIQLQKTQENLLQRLVRIETTSTSMMKKVDTCERPKNIIVHKGSAKKIYVASKEGKKFHMDNCPYAQNIKPKTKKLFKSKTTALNEGYKPCHCVK